MKKLWTSLAVLLCPIMGFAAVDQSTKNRMIADLDFIKNTFEVKYAPADWKRAHWGWDLDAEIAKAKQNVLNTDSLTIKDYQREVLRVLNTTRDYHVGVIFNSTEKSKLPFSVKSAEGKYFVVFIDDCLLCPGQFSIPLGSELVTFDGRPTNEVIEALMKSQFGGANPATDRAIAEMMLTHRSGKLGMKVPRGPIEITVRTPFAEELKSYQLIWDYTPERVQSDSRYTFWDNDSPPILSAREQVQLLLNKPWAYPFSDLFANRKKSHSNSADSDSTNPNEMGNREGFLPSLGKKIWQSSNDNPFDAYLFMTEDKKLIGYVRIPSYYGDVEEVDAFAAIIERFEDMTDALVIDQLNNPGGAVFYSYTLASMLSDKPLITPKHRIAITQAEVEMAVIVLEILEQIQDDTDARSALGESLSGYPVNYQLVRFIVEYYRTIIDEWNNKQYLTKPTYLFGIDQINPSPSARYTKPILLLVNSLDISCGDFFPAILQDNNRAVIFGTRTAGAGGFVNGFVYPNRFGIQAIFYTGSIAERINKQPIENLGVTPDISCEVTQNDLELNYADYVDAIQVALDQLIENGGKVPDNNKKPIVIVEAESGEMVISDEVDLP